MQLIACDLDRTLLPNGNESDDGNLQTFLEAVSQLPDVKIAYVTGRNRALFDEAVVTFGLWNPDYFLGAVGTEVYLQKEGSLVPHPKWGAYLQEKHPHWDRDEIVQALVEDEDFFLQEPEFQNQHKICYYIRDAQNKKDIYVDRAQKFIESNTINAQVVYSYDPLKKLGLLDILPTSATKLGAIQFVMQELGISKDDVIFAGDSGNDLLPLTAGFRSILVNNARPEIKEQAREIVLRQELGGHLYIATGDDQSNGNYASGVLEGLRYFGVL